MADTDGHDPERQRRHANRLGLALGLFVLAVMATLFAWKLSTL